LINYQDLLRRLKEKDEEKVFVIEDEKGNKVNQNRTKAENTLSTLNSNLNSNAFKTYLPQTTTKADINVTTTNKAAPLVKEEKKEEKAWYESFFEDIKGVGSSIAYGITEGIGALGTLISENAPYMLSNEIATKRDMEDYEKSHNITGETRQQIIDKYLKEYGNIDKAASELATLYNDKSELLKGLGGLGKFQDPEYYEALEKEVADIEYARDLLQETRGGKPFTDDVGDAMKAGLDWLGVGQFLEDFKEETSMPFDQVRELGQNTVGETAQEFAQEHSFVGGIAQSIGGLIPSIAATALTKNTAVGTAVFTASAKGSYYENYKEKGYSNREAENASTTMAAVELGTEFLGGWLGGINVFKQGALKEIAEKSGVQTIKALGIEGVEEATAELANIGIDLDLGEDVTLEEASKRIGTAFASGVALGAVMKGAGVAGSKAEALANKIKNNEQVTETELNEALEEVAEQNNTTVEAILEQEITELQQTTEQEQNIEETEKNEAPQAEISDVSEQSQQVIFPEVETTENATVEPNTAIEENIPIETTQNVSESEIIEENATQSEDKKQIQVYNAVRIDNKNANLDAEAKPHGLYLSNLYETDFNEFESPFTEDYEGGERHNYKVEPKNPLVVKPLVLDNAKYNYRSGNMATMEADASLSALKELVGEQEFTKVSEMSKQELIEYLNNKYSQYDFSNYYDKAELLMAYGSVEARNQGYDAIITERSTDPDTADIENEIVVLKNDILKTEAEATQETSKEEYIKNRLAELNAIDTSKMNLNDTKRIEIAEEIKALENGYTTIEEYRNAQKQNTVVEKEETTPAKQETKGTPTAEEIDNIIKLKEEGGQKYAKAYYDAVDKYGHTAFYKAMNEGYARAKNQDIAPVETTSKATTLKEEQYNIIQKNNPMLDDYHTGIRSVEDIKTFDEVINDDESFVWGDFSQEDAQKALEKGEVTVYSSYPIEQGTFVSTSKNQARDYAGNGKVYSKTVPLNEVAWISGDEGQYAKVEQATAEAIAPIAEQVEEAIAPLQETISDLTDKVEVLTDLIENAALNNPTIAENVADTTLDQQVEANNEPTDVVEYTTPEYDSDALLNEMMEVQNENGRTETTGETGNDSELQNRNEANARTVQEKVTREINEYKTEINDYVKDKITNSLGLDKKATKGIIDKLNSKETVTEQDVYEAFEGHREIKLPLDKSTEAEYKSIKAYFKDKKINIGSYNKADINAGEFNNFRRRYFGKTNFVLTGGENVDTAYMEMSDAFPHLFPDTITNPADQTMQIASVLDEVYNPTTETIELSDADMAEIVGTILDGYNMLNSYKTALTDKYTQELNEQANLASLEANLAPVQEETTPDIPIAENVVGTVAEAPVEETVTPTLQVSEELAPTQETTDGVQQQWNEEGEIVDTETIEKKTKGEIQRQLIEDAGLVKESLDNAKDVSKALMHNTDPIRLQEIIFGKELGGKINEAVFQTVKHNTAEKIRFQNKERDEIKELGIKPRSKESAAVQKYGEKQYINEAGETVTYKDAELQAEFPDVETQDKIKHAAKVIRQKYDTYIDMVNAEITKYGYEAIPKRQDYMRHFQELNDVFSRYGLPFNMQSAQANDLPVDINGLTADLKPGKNWFSSALRRKGNKTTYDAITGIDGYIEGIGNLIYHTRDIQTLRGFEDYVREMYGQENGFDNLDNLSDGEKAVRIQQIQNNHLGNYAAWLREYTNALAGKKAMADRAVEDIFGRRVYSFLNELKSQVGSNMTGLNIGSALTNPISMTQALAKTNKLATVKGYADTIKNIFVKDNFVEQNDFLTARFGSDLLAPTTWQKMRNAGQIFMTGTDWFASNSITRSKFYELKAKGMSDAQAHKEAGIFAAKILGDRSQGATPTLYNSKMLGLVTQFQLEVNNQLYSQFYDTFSDAKQTAKDKGVLKAAAGATFVLGQLAAFQYVYNNLYEAVAGRRPAFDIISMIATALGLGGDEEEEKKPLGDRLYEAADMLLDSLPYVSIVTGGGRIPISDALPISELISGQDQYGNDKSRLETLGEALPYYFLPTGYGQIKKTAGGLGMYDDELPVAGSYTDSGNLRFTAEEDTWSKIQAGLFGQWANPNAKAYIDSEFKSISKANIDELAELGYDSKEYNKYKSGLNEIKKMELPEGEARAKYLFDYIESQNATDKQKSTMIRNLLSDEEAKDVYDKLEMSSDEIIEYYETKATISQFEAESVKDEDKRAKVIDTILNADLTSEQKAYLYGKYYSSDKTLDKITSSGVDFNDYLKFTKETLGFENTEAKVEHLYNASLSENTKTVLYETSVLSGFDNEDKYKDYKTAKATGIDINAWLSYKKQEFKADKDRNGKSIDGTKKKKVFSHINSLDLSVPQKAIMFKLEYPADKDYVGTTYNNQIVSYVDGLDIDYEEKISVLENIGFKVDDEGNVKW